MEYRSLRGLLSVSVCMGLVVSCASGSDQASPDGSGGGGAASFAGSTGIAGSAISSAGASIVGASGAGASSAGASSAGASGAGTAGSAGVAGSSAGSAGASGANSAGVGGGATAGAGGSVGSSAGAGGSAGSAAGAGGAAGASAGAGGSAGSGAGAGGSAGASAGAGGAGAGAGGGGGGAAGAGGGAGAGAGAGGSGGTGCTACPYAVTAFVDGTNTGASASVNISWNATQIEFVFNVKDTTAFRDSANPWDDDAVEIYLDMNHSKSATFQADDAQIIVPRLNPGGAFSPTPGGLGTVTWASIVVVRTEVTGGYTLDVSVPWAALNGLGSQLGKTIGFDVGVDDDSDGGARNGQLMLYGTNQAFANTSFYGDLTLN